MRPTVAIIWLCYNNLRHLPEVVASWAAQTYPHDRLVVYALPAGSPDGIAEVIRRDVLPRSGKDLPEVVLLDTGKNEGFCGNNNVGIRAALERGVDYVFLQNGDLFLDAKAIEAAVTLAESDATIGAVQSTVFFWHDHEKVNVTGGAIHAAGYGYARDNGKRIDEVTLRDGEEIAYASGAAVLRPADVYRSIGLLEEGFFMYHDDLEYGLRTKIAGYKNVLSAQSHGFHDYQFSRNPGKFVWMETYRWVVLLAYLRVPSMLVLLPLWLAIEVGTWLMMAKSRMIAVKIGAYKAWLSPKTWRLTRDIRHRAKRLRTIPDRELVRLWTGKIEAQEASSPLLERVINPVVDAWWRALRKIIVW
ncbi:glycosyltransferase family 2 protein [Candidatus Uhrbacteria bacterium]|nr:glycosyltransferase family 2 protein [Candidatus Uhrbacteria bacterium]